VNISMKRSWRSPSPTSVPLFKFDTRAAARGARQRRPSRFFSVIAPAACRHADTLLCCRLPAQHCECQGVMKHLICSLLAPAGPRNCKAHADESSLTCSPMLQSQSGPRRTRPTPPAYRQRPRRRRLQDRPPRRRPATSHSPAPTRRRRGRRQPARRPWLRRPPPRVAAPTGAPGPPAAAWAGRPARQALTYQAPGSPRRARRQKPPPPRSVLDDTSSCSMAHDNCVR